MELRGPPEHLQHSQCQSGDTSVLRNSPSHPGLFQQRSQLAIHESPFFPHLWQNKLWLPDMEPSGEPSQHHPFLLVASQYFILARKPLV